MFNISSLYDLYEWLVLTLYITMSGFQVLLFITASFASAFFIRFCKKKKVVVLFNKNKIGSLY